MIYAFYVSGQAGRLRRLLQLEHKVLSDTRLVITDSERVLDLEQSLEEIGIELYCFALKKGRKNNLDLSDFLLKKLNEFKVDYCFCFGDNILKGELLEKYKLRIINFHPSVLPLFPGRRAVDKAVSDNSTILLGNTAHFVDDGIDTGPIIMQSIVSKSYMTMSSIDSILDLQLEMLARIYDYLELGKIRINDANEVCIDVEGFVHQAGFYFNTHE